MERVGYSRRLAGENIEIWAEDLSENWSSDYSRLLSTANVHTLSMVHSQARLSISHVQDYTSGYTDFPDVPIELCLVNTAADLITPWSLDHSNTGPPNACTLISHELPHFNRIL